MLELSQYNFHENKFTFIQQIDSLSTNYAKTDILNVYENISLAVPEAIALLEIFLGIHSSSGQISPTTRSYISKIK